MKKPRLGEFEEVILLLVGVLGEEAYAFKMAKEFEAQTAQSVSIGAVHATLSRLEGKGFLKSEMGRPSAVRGGRRKRIYSVTAYGQKTLEISRDLKLSLWNQFPAFSGKLKFGY